MPDPNLKILPDFPVDEDGPVFNEPWEARAFALAVSLRDQGLFTWTEWSQQLGSYIRAAREQGDPDNDTTYYRDWLACLESLVVRKGLVTPEGLADGKQQAHEQHQRLHTRSS